MSFKHISFYESEVMRELARNEQTNNPAPIKKEASVEKDLSPSESLQSDVLKLASELRERGFTSEANSIEDKYLAYKQAKTHLYKATEEDAEDLIEFAHPGKNPNVDDNGSEYGVVEDIFSAHKKIIDKVKKEPTGKISDAVLEELGLKKSAQEIDYDAAIYELLLEKGRLENSLKSKRVRHAGQKKAKISEIEKEINNLLLEKQKKEKTDEKEAFLKDYENYGKNIIASKIKKLLPKLKTLKVDPNNLRIFKDLIMNFEDFNNWESFKKRMKNIDSSLDYINSLSDLDNLIMKWERAASSMLSKSASLKKKLTKEAQQSVGIGVPNIPGMSAPIRSRNVGRGRNIPSARRDGRNPYPDEKSAVELMQTDLNSLARMLRSLPKDKLALYNITRNDISDLIRTGIGSGTARSSDAIDGLWGPNTNKALQAAANILKKLGVEGGLASVGPYRGGGRARSENNFTPQANSNLELLASAVRKLGGKSSSESKTKGSTVYDNLPGSFTPKSWRSLVPQTGDVSLGRGDLYSLKNLEDKVASSGLMKGSINPDGDNGYTLDQWSDFLNYLLARARYLKNKNYYQAVGGLFSNLLTYRDSKNLDGSDVVDSAMVAGKLPRSSEESASGSRGRNIEKGDSKSSGNAGEGDDLERAPKDKKLPPFQERLIHPDLKSERFGSLSSGFGPLSFRALGTSGQNMISRVNVRIPKAKFFQANRNLGINPSTPVRMGAEILKDTNGSPLTFGKAFDEMKSGNTTPEVRQIFKPLLNRTKAFVLTEALDQFSDRLSQLANEYVSESELSPYELNNFEKFRSLWIRAINNAMRSLQRLYQSSARGI